MQRPYLHDQPDYAMQPELAVAALIRMLVRFPVVGRAAMAESIARHLDIVAADARLPEGIRTAALGALQDWHGMLDGARELDLECRVVN